MARPITRSQCRRLQAQKAIKYHCIVVKDDQPYTIWSDEIGPIYSTPSTQEELKSAGIRDTFYMEPWFDSVTHNVMASARENGLHSDRSGGAHPVSSHATKYKQRIGHRIQSGG